MSTIPLPGGSPSPPPREERQPQLRIAGPILIVVAAFVLSIMVYVLLRAANLSTDSSEAIAAFVGSAAILGFGLLARAALPAHERRQITSKRWAIPAAIGIGLALGIGARIATGIVLSIGQAVDPGICRKLLELDDDLIPSALWHKVLLAIALVVLAPLGEELVFRGLFLRGLARRMSFPLAAVVSGIVFGFAHPQYWNLWPLLIAICGFGVAAAFIYRTMGFAANVTMHAVFNGVAAIFIFVDVDFSQESTTCE